MTNEVKQKANYLGLPKVTIEIEEITPEQRKKGEQGKVRVIEDTNSWLLQTPTLLSAYLRNSVVSPTVSVNDVIGTLRTPMEGRAAKFGTLGNTNPGVQVGTGTTAVTRDDNQLETRIQPGGGAGQFTYDANGALTKTTAITGGYRVAIERAFNNDSGADITINEAGVRFFFRHTPDDVGICLGLRDIISPGHTVVNGGAVILRYFFDWLA